MKNVHMHYLGMLTRVFIVWFLSHGDRDSNLSILNPIVDINPLLASLALCRTHN